MKKSILAITLMFALSSCGTSSTEETTSTTDKTAVDSSTCCDSTAQDTCVVDTMTPTAVTVK